MASGLLSLKWNHHKSTFIHVLSSIRRKESYSDVTIACDGKFYPVHKLVLSTCSEYFEEMFTRTECKHPVIVLKDIDADDFEALLNYMYVGEVNVLQEKLSSLIKAAEGLRIKGLAVADEEPTIRETPHKRTQNCSSPQAKRRRNDDLDAFRDEQQPRRRRESSSSVEHQQNNEQINCNSTVNKANPAIVPTSSPDESTEDNTALHQNNSPDNTQAEEAINEILLEEGAVKNEPVDPDDNDSKDFYVSDLSPDINQSPMQNPSTSGTWDDGGANQSDSTSGEDLLGSALFIPHDSLPASVWLYHQNISDSGIPDLEEVAKRQGVKKNRPRKPKIKQSVKYITEDSGGSTDTSAKPIKSPYIKKTITPSVEQTDEDSEDSTDTSSKPLKSPFIKENITPSAKEADEDSEDLNDTSAKALESHFNQKKNYYECPSCDRHMASQQAFRYHMKQHSGIKKHACIYCNFRSIQKCSLNTHMKCHEVKNFPFSCTKCVAGFRSQFRLNTHLKKCH